MDTFDKAAKKAALEVADIIISKRKDYGPGNIMNSVVGPELSIAVRLNDKVARLANLAKNGTKPENETLRDTADDIIGYGLVLKLFLEGNLLLPLEEKASTNEKLNQFIGEKVGEATMCWNPIPAGVFDSQRAAKIVDEINKVVNNETTRTN